MGSEAEVLGESDVKGRHSVRRQFLHLLRELQFATPQCQHPAWAPSEETVDAEDLLEESTGGEDLQEGELMAS